MNGISFFVFFFFVKVGLVVLGLQVGFMYAGLFKSISRFFPVFFSVFAFYLW